MASDRVEDPKRGLLGTCKHTAPACWRCVALDMERQRDALRARLAEAERLLREVDKTSWGELGFCLTCDSGHDGHVEGCALARWLEGGGR